MKRAMLVSFVLGLAAGSAYSQPDPAVRGLPPAPIVSAAPCPVPVPPAPERASGCRLLELEADYLFWWIRRPALNTPLVTTGGTGVLGDPNTFVVVGNGENVPYNGQSGARVGATLWLGEDSRFGINLSGFALSRTSGGRVFASDATGSPVIAQPILNAVTGVQEAFAISDPAGLAGGYVNSHTSSLFGWEVNGVLNTRLSDDVVTVRALAGFRHIGLREEFSERVTISDPGQTGLLLLGTVPTALLSTVDTFQAHTDFYGGQVGARVGYQVGRFGIDLTGKVALGVSQQRVNIFGLSQDAAGNALAGGLRALTSNIGRHTASDFAVAPELGLNVVYRLTQGVALRAGYNFLYLSRVVRPTDQIDVVTNPGLVPSDRTFGAAGPARPAFDRQASDFWAHGLNAGLVITF